MALGKNTITGRFNASQTPVMKRIRKPKFVDNGVRHGEYTKQQSGFLVKAPTSSDFMPTHDRRYALIEEEDTIRLSHNASDGHRYTGSIFLDKDRVSTDSNLPPLIIGADNPDQALVPASIEASAKGTRYRLGNLKGRELKQIGFTDKVVRIAQKANVGLRTTDLVSRIAKSSTSSINGLTIKNPSGTFVAQDFYGVDGVSAIRFLAKHDGYNASTDQFGNIHYSHQKKHGREHRITNTMVSEGSVKSSGKSTLNRVVVRGKVRANNDQNVVQIDDFGPQKDMVNEIPGGVYAPTAITKASAKMIGRRLLSMAKKAEGNEKLKGVLMSSRVQPGDVVSYDTLTSSERKIVLSTRHYLTGRKSDIDINSVEGSIEDILQRFQEVDISSSTGDNEERNRQYSKEEFATAFGFNIKVSWRVETRKVDDPTGGIAIGIPNRNTVHGRRQLKSTGILINNGGGYAAGTTNFTTDGTNANSVFTSGIISAGKADAFVYRANGNLLGKLSSASTTSVVITKVSPDLVENNEELFQISTDTLPESANGHLKIRMNKGTFSNRRRG
tara:strand:+ start:712 stop:2382 length:1671 start_codon:yes stop_codon:yes gene_type:complete